MEAEGHRLRWLRVQGMRTLADVHLPLDGLTVLIGENGSGKSTLLEALEIMTKAPRRGDFINDHLLPIHGDLFSLLRRGERELSIEVGIEGPQTDDETALTYRYWFELTWDGRHAVLSREFLGSVNRLAKTQKHWLPLMVRNRSSLQIRRDEELVEQSFDYGSMLVLAMRDVSLLQPVREVLDRGVVHVPFEVRPYWLAREHRLDAPLREPSQLIQSSHLKRLGANLANAFYELHQRSRDEWEKTLELVRAGLGDRVLDIKHPAAQPGAVSLALEMRGLSEPITTVGLSDGQLSYLAFVALHQLGADHSFIAFDEPDAHLNPALLVRVVWMLESLARERPVVLATQSDHLLDSLENPADSVVVCELNEDHATQLQKLDAAKLDKWMEEYNGVGAIRSDGELHHVFQSAE